MIGVLLALVLPLQAADGPPGAYTSTSDDTSATAPEGPSPPPSPDPPSPDPLAPTPPVPPAPALPQPGPAAAALPTTPPAATTSPPAPAGSTCLALVRTRDREKAEACYRQRAIVGDEESALARELADIVAALRLPPPSSLVAPVPPAVGPASVLLSPGRAELMAATTLGGGALAGFVQAGLARSSGPAGDNGATLLLAPVVGGVLGLAGGAATALLWPDLSAGDALVARTSIMLGAFDAITVFVLLESEADAGGYGLAPFAAAGILAASGVAGGALAALTELPEGASALAVSGAVWSSVLGTLGSLMFQTFRASARPELDTMRLLLVTGNLGFLGGMALGTVVPVTRADTWALDVGGAVGLLAGAALAVNARAPNPFLGWGSMAAGSVVGMGAGVAAVRLLPGWLDEVRASMAKDIEVGPLAVTGRDAHAELVPGVALRGRL